LQRKDGRHRGDHHHDVQRAISVFDAAGLTYERKLQQVVFEIQRCYFAHEAGLSIWNKFLWFDVPEKRRRFPKT
jgi:hypothetical protein